MSEIKVNKVSPATGTAITLGDSGDTFTVPSGATIVNSGTATGFGGGKLLGFDSDIYTTQTSTTAAIDARMTGIPQQTDGTEIMTVTITPTASSSTLLVNSTLTIAPGGDGYKVSAFLFRDSTANALVFGQNMMQSGGDFEFVTLQTAVSAASTSSTTFKIRWAAHTGQTAWINRASSQTSGGGSLTSSLWVMEIGA
jgi:hypothetical protein